MRCPFCHHPDTRVIDSRYAPDTEQIRRRRVCESCRERFTTYESAELSLPRVIKSRDGRREPFSEEKLRAGMERALRKSTVPTEKLDAAVNRIKRKLRGEGTREVNTQRIGKWVMEELRDLDHVAYIRFASVYHNFSDVRAFLEEIAGLENVLTAEAKRHQLALALSSATTAADVIKLAAAVNIPARVPAVKSTAAKTAASAAPKAAAPKTVSVTAAAKPKRPPR